MIDNFGKVKPHRIYRGAQPKHWDYEYLLTLNPASAVMVIDLRDDPIPDAQSVVEAFGMHYVNLPMSDHDYPPPDVAPRFLDLVTSWQGTVFVYCAGGRHRTGVMAAVYRMSVDRWTLGRAMKELESYDFGWFKWRWWNHTELKRFVKDYWAKLQKTYE